MRGDPTFWLIARAGGLAAYALLAASVLAGLVLKARPFRGLRAADVADAHRFLALLALSATGVHGLALTLDATSPISVEALVVPGVSSYRPLWTALGVLAAELMLVVYVSFALRRRIGARAWRRLHWATYAIFAAATLHGLAAGTDSGQAWALALYLSGAGAVAAAAGWRALAAHPRTRPERSTA